MGRFWSLAVSPMFLALLASCFSEPDSTPSNCELGAMGCHCQADESCETSDLVCRNAYCIPVSCVPGQKYCQCDAGACDESLVCQDGAICLPPDDGGETSSAPSTSITDTTGTTSATTTSETTATTTTTAATDTEMTTSATDTGMPLPFCDATPEALFCGDFDDGTYDMGFAEPVPRGGGTVDVVEDPMILPPSPTYALRVVIPENTSSQTGGLLAAAYEAQTPFVGTARTAVRFEPGCFDADGAPERRVLALSFYAKAGGFVGGVRIDTAAEGGHLYQVDGNENVTGMVPLTGLMVTDAWMEFEISIDAATGSANIRVNDGTWTGQLAALPLDIVPYITVGPISNPNPRACTVWFDDIAVLPWAG